MKVYKIEYNGESYVTDEAAQIASAPAGSTVQVVEMTDEEYYAIPATSESAQFFG